MDHVSVIQRYGQLKARPPFHEMEVRMIEVMAKLSQRKHIHSHTHTCSHHGARKMCGKFNQMLQP